MAKLIDPAATERPIPRIGGDIAQVRSSANTEAAGKGLAALGDTIADVFGRIDDHLVKSRRQSQLTEAMGKATAEIGELEIKFQHDQDFKTSPKRFMEQTEAIRKRYETSIDDGVVRGAFTKRFSSLATTKRLNVLQIAAKQEGDHNVAVLDDSLDTYATAASNAANVAEREVVFDEAALAIEGMRNGGWITDVDAGKRSRGFMNKVDTSTVLRDIQNDPGETATKLSLSADYAPNLDPVQRERLIDSSLRQADARGNEDDRKAERLRKTRATETMKTALDLDAAGTLTRKWVEENRSFVDAHEYKAMLTMLEPGTLRDDPVSYAALERMVYDNPARAERLAFQLHKTKKITNATLGSALARTRSISREEGPRTAYERERLFITNAVKPSEFVPDPAASARFAIIIREYDDYAGAATRSDKDLRTKADELLKKHSMIDMQELATRTSAGARNDPQSQLDALASQEKSLTSDFKAGKVNRAEYNRRMGDLNKARKAAEKALQTHGTKP